MTDQDREDIAALARIFAEKDVRMRMFAQAQNSVEATVAYHLAEVERDEALTALLERKQRVGRSGPAVVNLKGN